MKLKILRDYLKHIKTLEELVLFIQILARLPYPVTAYLVMKRRPNFQPFMFEQIGQKIHYLITDGVSVGSFKPENAHKVFDIFYQESK